MWDLKYTLSTLFYYFEPIIQNVHDILLGIFYLAISIFKHFSDDGISPFLSFLQAFPWGDGKKSLIHSHFNALPDGYEDEEH